MVDQDPMGELNLPGANTGAAQNGLGIAEPPAADQANLGGPAPQPAAGQAIPAPNGGPSPPVPMLMQQLEVIIRKLIGDTLPGHLAPILGAVGSAQDSSSDLAQQNAKDLRLMTLDMRTKDRLEAVRLSKEGNAKVIAIFKVIADASFKAHGRRSIAGCSHEAGLLEASGLVFACILCMDIAIAYHNAVEQKDPLPYWLPGLPDEYHLRSLDRNCRNSVRWPGHTACHSPSAQQCFNSACYANLHMQTTWAAIKTLPVPYEVLIVIADFRRNELTALRRCFLRTTRWWTCMACRQLVSTGLPWWPRWTRR